MTFSQLKAQKDFAAVAVPQDGYCLMTAVHKVLHANSNCKLTLSALKKGLKSELLKVSNNYLAYFVNKSQEAFAREVARYVDQGVYNSDVGDVCLEALCNSLGIDIVIYEEHDGYVSEIKCTPSRFEATVCRPTVNLVRYGLDTLNKGTEHYDALISLKHSTSSSMPTSSLKSTTERKKSSQSTIYDMFAKPPKRTETCTEELCPNIQQQGEFLTSPNNSRPPFGFVLCHLSS